MLPAPAFRCRSSAFVRREHMSLVLVISSGLQPALQNILIVNSDSLFVTIAPLQTILTFKRTYIVFFSKTRNIMLASLHFCLDVFYHFDSKFVFRGFFRRYFQLYSYIFRLVFESLNHESESLKNGTNGSWVLHLCRYYTIRHKNKQNYCLHYLD